MCLSHYPCCKASKKQNYYWHNFIHRGVDKHSGMLDLCVLVLRESKTDDLSFSKLMTCSRRQLKSFVGCNVMLPAGEYVLVPLAFNHWSNSELDIDVQVGMVVIEHSQV